MIDIGAMLKAFIYLISSSLLYPGLLLMVILTLLIIVYARVRLAALMLVAGMPFEEDLVGIEKSWKAAFKAAGIQVELEPGRLGLNPQIIVVFWRHMEAALDIIPQNGRVAQ